MARTNNMMNETKPGQSKYLCPIPALKYGTAMENECAPVHVKSCGDAMAWQKQNPPMENIDLCLRLCKCQTKRHKSKLV
eukprot:8295137-Lingulodinium_polyedra.AAC.1